MSRMTSRVHLSPTSSSRLAIGQGDRGKLCAPLVVDFIGGSLHVMGDLHITSKYANISSHLHNASYHYRRMPCHTSPCPRPAGRGRRRVPAPEGSPPSCSPPGSRSSSS